MRIFTPITTEAAAPTTTGAASTVGSSTHVRIVNTGTAEHLVTLEKDDGTDIGTFTVESQETAFIKKEKTDKIFAANVAVLLCGVKFEGLQF